MYENCLYGLNIIIDNKITNAIYDLIFLDFISFLLKKIRRTKHDELKIFNIWLSFTITSGWKDQPARHNE